MFLLWLKFVSPLSTILGRESQNSMLLRGRMNAMDAEVLYLQTTANLHQTGHRGFDPHFRSQNPPTGTTFRRSSLPRTHSPRRFVPRQSWCHPPWVAPKDIEYAFLEVYIWDLAYANARFANAEPLRRFLQLTTSSAGCSRMLFLARRGTTR